MDASSESGGMELAEDLEKNGYERFEVKGVSAISADIKKDFPILQQQVHGKPLIYLDSGNTSQKPKAVIDAMTSYYETINANVHRGSYEIAVKATDALEGARAKVLDSSTLRP